MRLQHVQSYMITRNWEADKYAQADCSTRDGLGLPARHQLACAFGGS